MHVQFTLPDKLHSEHTMDCGMSGFSYMTELLFFDCCIFQEMAEVFRVILSLQYKRIRLLMDLPPFKISHTLKQKVGEDWNTKIIVLFFSNKYTGVWNTDGHTDNSSYTVAPQLKESVV